MATTTRYERAIRQRRGKEAMRIITDPESWTGLRSSQAVAKDLAPQGEAGDQAGGSSANGLGAVLRRVLRVFGRR